MNDSNMNRKWRSLCAADKVRNIVRMCESVNHKIVLEIGAGDGSILNRLVEVDFSEKMYGLEVSNDLVQQIKKRKIPRLIECVLFDGYSFYSVS